MKKKALSLILALVICLGLLPTTALAANTVSVAPGYTVYLELDTNVKGPFSWSSDNTAVATVPTGNTSKACVVTGVSPGTTTIRCSFKVTRASVEHTKYGDPVIRYERATDSVAWTVNVTAPISEPAVTGADTSASTPTPTTPTPEKSDGTVGENVEGTLEGIGVFNNGLVPVKRDGLWGYADKDMKLVIPFQYRSASYMWDCGVAEVNLNGKWCAIDSKGKVVASGARYDQIGRKTFGSVNNSGEYIDFFNAKGEKVSYETAQSDLNDWYAWLHDSGCLAFDCVERGQWQFGTIYDLKDHVLSFAAPAGVDTPSKYSTMHDVMVVRKDGLYGAVDKTGAVVIPIEYTRLNNSSYAYGYLSYEKDGEYGVIPASGPSEKPTTPATPTTPTTPSESDFTIERGVLTKYTGKGGAVTIPSTVKAIGVKAFENCKSLTSVTIPASVKVINLSAFENCENLTSVAISDGVTDIMTSAFYGCGKLTDVTIPASVTEIGFYVFDKCDTLKDIYYGGTKTQWKAVTIGSDNDFLKTATIHYSDGSSSKPDSSASPATTPTTPSESDFTIESGVLTNYNGKGGAVTIPGSVKVIGESAFKNCESLTSVTIPGSVKEIRENAFRNCKSLTSVTISDGVTDIEGWAFFGCSKLTDVTIPDSVKVIGPSAFHSCERLTSVTIPAGVTDIQTWAFLGCSKLTDVAIPASVTKISPQAFDKCDALKVVYYGGTEAQWKAITVGEKNDPLKKATIHYSGGSSSKPDSPALPEVEQIPASGTAYATTQNIRINNVPVRFHTYILRDASGGDTNYVRLRDIAYVLGGTGAQFEVRWDGEIRVETKHAYTAIGGEMDAAFSGDQRYRGGASNVWIDGRTVPLTAIILTDAAGGDYTYFKLRDLGAVLNFKVDWTPEEGVSIQAD